MRLKQKFIHAIFSIETSRPFSSTTDYTVAALFLLRGGMSAVFSNPGFQDDSGLIPRSVAMVWIEIPSELSYEATAARLNCSV